MNSLRQIGVGMSLVRVGRCGAKIDFVACCAALGLLLFAWAPVAAAGLGAAVATNDSLRWDGEMFDPACWASLSGTGETRIEQVGQWIKQLGHTAHGKREEASRALIRSGAAATDQLMAAAHDSDPEVAMRAVAVLAEIRRREAKKTTKAAPIQVLAPQIPVDIGVRNSSLGLLGETSFFVQYSAMDLAIHLPLAAYESRPSQVPFFLVMADMYWHPVPVWVGPRMVQVPEDTSQLPWRPAIDLSEYDLLTELNERWEPTTAKAKVRVQALERYLALGGTFTEWMLPMVPVPAWVAVLRQRLARGDAAALPMLCQMGVKLPADDVLRLVKEAQGRAREANLRSLATVDPKPYVAAFQGLLNGSYANDVPLLEVLGAAGVAIAPDKLNYPADEIAGPSDPNAGYQLIQYCRRMRIQAPNGLLERCLRGEMFVNCADLLSAAQKEYLKKTLADKTEPERVRFHARCLLFLSGDQTQEEKLLQYFPPGTPYQNGYNSDNLEEYFRGTLDQLASDGHFPGRAQSLLKQELFDSDKIGPSVSWILGTNATPEQVAEVVRKLDGESAAALGWLLGDWHCRAAVPSLVKALDALDCTEESQYGYNRIVHGLGVIADPLSGPCLVRAIEKIEQTRLHMTPETRMEALSGLMRMGADFPDGKKTLRRVIANERRFSVFRMVALAGMARQAPGEELAVMLKEVEAAPPAALPLFLKWLADTGLSGAVPTLKKHLTNRYPPAAKAAADGLASMGVK